MGSVRTVTATIFFTSLTGLAYEIILIRTFSITLWYHFAFMVISIAMLGIGASGTLLSLYPGLRDLRHLPKTTFLYCITIPVSFSLVQRIPFEPARLSWDTVQVLFIGLSYLVLAVPFFLFGLIVSISYSTLAGRAMQIYGADLTGAGMGSLLALLLLSLHGPERAVLLLSAFSLLSVTAIGQRTERLLALFTACLVMVVAFFRPPFSDLRISPYKPLEAALQYPGAETVETYNSPFSRVDVFRSPAVHFAPGLSLRYLDALPLQTGISVDAGEIFAITEGPGPVTRLGFIPYLPAALPYVLSQEKKSALIIDPKGGLGLLVAAYHGVKEIAAVESSYLVIDAVNDHARGVSAHIYEKNTWTGLARSRLASRSSIFDIIDISLTGFLPAGSFGFSEDYRFTVEAFSEYLLNLPEEGFLAVNLYIIPPPRTELRLITTLAAAFERLRIPDFDRHIAVVRSWGTVTIVVKKGLLSREDIGAIRGFAEERRFDTVYYPGVSEAETNRFVRMPTNDYFAAVDAIVSPSRRDAFLQSYLFDVRPVFDDRPFFHYSLRLKNLEATYRVMGGKWQYFMEEGYLLPVIFLQVSLITLLLILLPVLCLRRKAQLPQQGGLLPAILYFTFLAVGYLFLEVSFLQQMILPLEHPSYAAATVLSTILVSSGAGSFLSTRSRLLRRPIMLPCLALAGIVSAIFLPHLRGMIGHLPLGLKIGIVGLSLFPIGMLMGLPFPQGMTVLTLRRPDLVPLAWAVNGCFSVMAPLLATMVAITFGYRVVLGLAAVVYAAAFFALRQLGSLPAPAPTGPSASGPPPP